MADVGPNARQLVEPLGEQLPGHRPPPRRATHSWRSRANLAGRGHAVAALPVPRGVFAWARAEAMAERAR